MRPTIACILAVLVLTSTAACSRSLAQDPGSWSVLFGPVSGNELIVGRTVRAAEVWIATDRNALVRIDVAGRRHSRLAVTGLRPGERIWGLAQSGGALWSLAARHALARIGDDGVVDSRRELKSPHLGLFSDGEQLIYQVANVEPPADALTAGPPGEADRKRWGQIRTRALPLVRGAVAALNLISCGPPTGPAVPCWFPDQAAIVLTERNGRSSDIPLVGVPVVAPEVLLASEHPQRPVRDALATARGDLWILASGEGPVDPRPGGRLLIRLDPDRREVSRVTLPEPARLILQASEAHAVLLAWDSRVVEVRP